LDIFRRDIQKLSAHDPGQLVLGGTVEAEDWITYRGTSNFNYSVML